MSKEELERELTAILSGREMSIPEGHPALLLDEVIDYGTVHTLYQPIVHHTNHTIVGFEALSRPVVRGVSVRPDLWFYAAYLSEKSVQADCMAFQSSMEHVGFLKQFDGCRLFVNVLPTSILDKSFVKHLEQLLERGSCRPYDLVIEIVEYIPYDPVVLAICIQSLRRLGLRIALDDIKLHDALPKTLTELRPDYVKFDRSVIHDILTSKKKRHQISRLIRDFSDKMTFIAEGVEDLKDLLVVQELGIHLSQGYYWTQPMRASEELYLRTQIELTRSRLFDVSRTMNGSLSGEVVVEISRKLDDLIVKYQRLTGSHEIL